MGVEWEQLRDDWYSMPSGDEAVSKLTNAALELAEGLHKAGAMDETTWREIKMLAEELPPCDPDDVRRIRQKAQMSQAVFAKLLGTRTTTVRKWEQGQSKPSGPARRLLDVVDRKGIDVLL